MKRTWKWPWEKIEGAKPTMEKAVPIPSPAPPVAEELKHQQALYDQLMNQQIEKGLLQSAYNLRDRFRDNWFTLLQVIKKTNVKNALDARQLMNMLELKGMCVKTIHNNEEKYKIHISYRLQIENLQEQLRKLEHQKGRIQEMIEGLEQKQLEEKDDKK